jgi:hypothetical protein
MQPGMACSIFRGTDGRRADDWSSHSSSRKMIAMVDGFNWLGALVAAIGAGLVVGVIILVYFRNVRPREPNADPLIEAGFYYAYGQRKRAIQILEQARLAHPEREDLARRLAEWRNG